MSITVAPTSPFSGQPSVNSHIVFDVRSAAPNLAAELIQTAPSLSFVLEGLGAKLPIPDRPTIDAEKQFYRLSAHNRSYCYALGGGADLYKSPALVFKGVEPLFDDFAKFIDWLTLAPFRRSSRVMADHFALGEGKIPGALSLKEATREASIAIDIQAKHFAAYGEFARLPMPLLVHRFADDDASRVVKLLQEKLPSASFERIEPLLGAGLGAYIYFYPVAPIRANAYGGGATSKVADYIRKHVEPERTVTLWIQLLARLLHLGFLPYTPRNEGLGGCMDYGNATLDGGFCDPDSIEPITQCPDDEFFYESLAMSLKGMELTVARLASPDAGFEQSDLYPSIERFAVSSYVAHEFRRALDTEARPGLTLDRRVADLVTPSGFSTLTRVLERRPRSHTYAMFVRQQAAKR